MARLRRNRSEHLDPVLAKYGGRLVKLTGDGALVEFPSAVDALSAAIELQQAMAEANGDQPADTAFAFRMGLHLGDLIVDGADLYGDGVNVAARLEGGSSDRRHPDSRNVRDAVAGKSESDFRGSGRPFVEEHRTTGSDFQGTLGCVRLASASRLQRCQSLPAAAPRRCRCHYPTSPPSPCFRSRRSAGDPEQEYFADGIVEEIITALSRILLAFHHRPKFKLYVQGTGHQT